MKTIQGYAFSSTSVPSQMWPLISKSSLTPHPGYGFGVVVVGADVVVESVSITLQSLFGKSRFNKIRNICKLFCRPMFTFQSELDHVNGSSDNFCLHFSCCWLARHPDSNSCTQIHMSDESWMSSYVQRRRTQDRAATPRCCLSGLVYNRQIQTPRRQFQLKAHPILDSPPASDPEEGEGSRLREANHCIVIPSNNCLFSSVSNLQ